MFAKLAEGIEDADGVRGWPDSALRDCLLVLLLVSGHLSTSTHSLRDLKVAPGGGHG